MPVDPTLILIPNLVEPKWYPVREGTESTIPSWPRHPLKENQDLTHNSTLDQAYVKARLVDVEVIKLPLLLAWW